MQTPFPTPTTAGRADAGTATHLAAAKFNVLAAQANLLEVRAQQATGTEPNRDTVHGLLLSGKEGFALAELCKRISFSACRELAVDDAEAHLMIDATNRLRACLAQNDWVVR